MPIPRSEDSCSRLISKLRRLGGLFLLFFLLLLAALHWISQDIRVVAVTAPGSEAFGAGVEDVLRRIDVVLFLTGLVMVPTFAVASVFVARFVRSHFDELDQANRHKSQFVSMVSHELRTPLNAINGFAVLLKTKATGTMPGDQADCLREIESAAKHMKSLITDLLDVARIESGKITLVESEFKLDEVMTEALSVARPVAAARSVQLVLSGEAGATVFGDRKRVKQILLNLISNAVKFSPEDGAVSLKSVPGAVGIIVTVSDQGSGISEEEQAKLFREYYQTSSGRAGGEGSGLGLAISKRLIEMHGGDIWVDSDRLSGTTFHFSLPASRVRPFDHVEAGAVAWVPAAAGEARQPWTM